jgi:hypothetical protein
MSDHFRRKYLSKSQILVLNVRLHGEWKANLPTWYLSAVLGGLWHYIPVLALD